MLSPYISFWWSFKHMRCAYDGFNVDNSEWYMYSV